MHKNIIWASALLLLEFVLFACSGGSTSSSGSNTTDTIPQGFARIKGVVELPSNVDASEKKSAEVYVVGQETNKVLTNADGTYSLLVDLSKSNVVTSKIMAEPATAKQYELIIHSSSKEYGKKTDVEVSDGEDKNIQSIKITKTGTITGKAYLQDQTDHTGIIAYIPGTSFIAMTNATGNYTFSQIPEGTYDSMRADKDGYNYAVLSNVTVTTDVITTVADQTLLISTGAQGQIIIADGADYSTSSTVKLTIAATDDAILMTISEESTFLNAVWQPVQSSLDYTFTSGGDKNLYIKFSNANGLESLPFSDSIYIVGPGSLDPTFGTGGKVITNFGAGQDNALAVAIQSDGKIIAAGISYSDAYYANPNHKYDFALVRYNSDGTLDTPFGSGGKVTTDIGGTDAASAVAIQGDGKIVAAGSSYSGINNGFAIVRYNPDGSLDSSFGSSGIVTTLIAGGGQAFAMLIQPDGKIVAAGASSGDFAIARYNTNGSLDLTFGANGIITTDLGSLDDQASSIALQNNGKIVAAGSTGSRDFALVRYSADGSLDPTFGTGGKVVTDFGTVYDHAAAVVLQADGKIVAAGVTGAYSYYDFALARYTVDGSLDSTFGNGGKVTTAFGSGGNDQANAVALQSDGKIIAAGYSSGDFAVTRYDSNGTLDGTFDTDGKVTIDFGGFDEAAAVAVQSDGSIVAAGGNNENYFAIVRLGH